MSGTGLNEVLGWMESVASDEVRQGMTRYGIPNDDAYGIPMGVMKKKAKEYGRDHALALHLWAHGRYESRTIAAFVAEPDRFTAEEMDRWAGDFDSWAICDTVCFHLFDRTPYAWDKVHLWAPREEEFVRRAGYALLWALSVHDKAATDDSFRSGLQIILRSPADSRPLVKKAVDMALRAVGKRNRTLNDEAREVARAMTGDDDPDRSWIGRHALKELESDKVQARLRS